MKAQQGKARLGLLDKWQFCQIQETTQGFAEVWSVSLCLDTEVLSTVWILNLQSGDPSIGHAVFRILWHCNTAA